MDPHDVASSGGPEESTDSGTDPDMPALIDYKMSRSRSNTFERRPRAEALETQREWRNQVRRRCKSAGVSVRAA